MKEHGAIGTGGRVEELDEEECCELLGVQSVGRVAFAGADGPMILPINYVYDSGVIVFRTAPYNVMAVSLRNVPVAFEIDEIDDYLQAGWSVLVQGTASYVDEVQDALTDLSRRPEPWVEGTRPLYIRIVPRVITGRRVHPR